MAGRQEMQFAFLGECGGGEQRDGEADGDKKAREKIHVAKYILLNRVSIPSPTDVRPTGIGGKFAAAVLREDDVIVFE